MAPAAASVVHHPSQAEIARQSGSRPMKFQVFAVLFDAQIGNVRWLAPPGSCVT